MVVTHLNRAGRAVILRMVKSIALAVYTAALLLLIPAMSSSSYEWMIGEKRGDGTVVSLCGLPPPIDDISREAAILFLVLILLPLGYGAAVYIREKRVSPTLFVGGGLLLYWLWFFFGRYVGC